MNGKFHSVDFPRSVQAEHSLGDTCVSQSSCKSGSVVEAATHNGKRFIDSPPTVGRYAGDMTRTGDQPHEIKPFLTTNCEFSSARKEKLNYTVSVA